MRTVEVWHLAEAAGGARGVQVAMLELRRQ